MNTILSKKDIKAITKALPAIKKVANADVDIVRRVKVREFIETLKMIASPKK